MFITPRMLLLLIGGQPESHISRHVLLPCGAGHSNIRFGVMYGVQGGVEWGERGHRATYRFRAILISINLLDWLGHN